MSENNELTASETESVKLNKEIKYRMEMLNLIKDTLPEMTAEEWKLFSDLFLAEKADHNLLLNRLKELT